MAVAVDTLREQRALEIENALASVRIEGLEPSAEALAIFERYVEGELSMSEMGAEFDAYVERTYRSVRLSGH
ncbi:MAG: hypothetical protein FJW38_22355 [Acidobacteria bacterium]|nr:hypothetical protein [Acidobacteriota bacterium]